MPAMQKRIDKGFHAHSVPDVLQKYAEYQPHPKVEPRNTIFDNRSKEQKEQALMGVEDTSLNDKMQPYKQSPHILFSTQMGQITEPSLYKSEALGIMLMIFRNPENVM